MKLSFTQILTSSLVASLLVLSGCSIGQKSSPSIFYVLTPMPADTNPLPEFNDDPPNVGVSRVQIPSFIDRPQLTYRLNKNEINFSEFHRWGEPIGDGVTRVLRQNLTELLGAGKVSAFPWMQPYPRDFVFGAVVTDFAAGSDGRARLTVIYRISDAKNEKTLLVREAQFVDSDGEALAPANAVAAMSRLLEQFSKSAAQDLANVNRQLDVEALENLEDSLAEQEEEYVDQ
ncbi:MAG: PqiC family protein [Verrucomicrobiota bacterium]